MIIGRIRSLDITEPIARFNTGFQILRQKVDEWNSVSHKLNHLRDLEIEIAQYVQRWMRLELQCWRECLATTWEKYDELFSLTIYIDFFLWFFNRFHLN